MSDRNGVTLREHIEGIFQEFKDRYESERQSAQDAFEEFKDGLDEKTKLQATEYERRLTAYPTIQDFNKLKEKVTIEFAAELGKNKARLYTITIVGVLISVLAVAATWFRP